MDSGKSEKIDVIADGLDDLKTTTDELQSEVEEGDQDADPNTINKLQDALEQASDAADDLDNQSKN
jgi:uncharacterized membrane protein (DUF106 family)